MATRKGESPVLVAGGGIGGLTLALALAGREFCSTVLERSSFTEETGAGIQLGPNATRALRAFGVLEAIEAQAFKPEALELFDGLSGRRLATMPLGPTIEDRYGAPYLTLHRADLHAALLQACQNQPPIELKPRFEVTAVEQHDATVTASATTGKVMEGSILVAADGLWSTLRARVDPHAAPRFAGQTAWRAVLLRASLPSPFHASVIGLWLGPRAHLVHYPVRGGKELNLVAVVEGGSAEHGWDRREDQTALLARFARWAKTPQSLLEMADGWRAWSLYRLPPLRRWSAGRIALLGDAAHPVLPFLAQGAALTIEDAVTLADCLGACVTDPEPAFSRYEALRRKRTARIQQLSARMGRIYHLGAVGRIARNAVLRRRRPAKLLSSFDWLYR
jgi:2-polyprenyl-6-methoxyphenol hydroxylase-like FAD-dependent oxidoreductase